MRVKMSHIIKSNEDIKNFSYLLEEFRKNENKDDIIYEIINTMLPENNNYQAKVILRRDDRSPAYFSPEKKIISIHPELLEKHINKYFVNKNIHKINKYFPEINSTELYNYFAILVLAHEIEHLYQYLIGYNHIEFPYKIVKDAYKNIYDMLCNRNTLLQEYRYKMNSNPTLLIEKNANIEAINLICKIAKYEDNNDIYELFNQIMINNLKISYIKFYNGAIEETYSKFLAKKIYKTFDKTEDVPTEERIRYGLPISKKEKKKLLKDEFHFKF